jgi:hypothetical protein
MPFLRALFPVTCLAILSLSSGPGLAREPARRATAGAAAACVLTLEVRQNHWTLDPLEYAKDHINAMSFDIPADRAFCDGVQPGTVLDERFRWGSWLIRQNYGHWTVRVVGKAIHGVPQGGAVPAPKPVAPEVAPPPAPSSAVETRTSPRMRVPTPYEPGTTPGVDDPLVLPAPAARSD